MKCPKCQHEPTMSDMKVSPGTCPNCGVIYEKYIQALKRQAAISIQQQKKPTVEPPAPSAAAPSTGQPQQVVITDIRMNFLSMVVFMVKWALAAIPAMIIIFLIVGMMSAVLTGLAAGFFSGGSKSSASQSRPSNYQSAPDKSPSTQPADQPLISAYLADKGFDDDQYQPRNTLKIKFENNSGKDIVAFEGVVTLKDLLGNTITKSRVTDNTPQWSDGSYFWSGSIKYNRFNKDDNDLKNTPITSLRMTFDLKKVLYEDGEIVEF